MEDVLTRGIKPKQVLRMKVFSVVCGLIAGGICYVCCFALGMLTGVIPFFEPATGWRQNTSVAGCALAAGVAFLDREPHGFSPGNQGAAVNLLGGVALWVSFV